ncbi:MAG: 30S ribosomal protein S17 [Pirellulaceae bacterium]
MPKKVLVGRVTSDKMDKTRRVEIVRHIRHPLYGKYYSRRMACHVHDETNESALGDQVEIIESRPRSKTKRWELVKVIEKSREVDVAALKAARDAGVAMLEEQEHENE